MDVKACDGCKKTNLEAELYQFWEQRQRQSEGRIAPPDAPLVGFMFRKLVTTWDDVNGPSSYSLLCKPCAQKAINVDLAIL